MNNSPEKVHQRFVNEQMEEFGIKTEADVTKIKKEEKEKIAQLDRLEKTLEKAEEKGAATEEHKKLKAAIARHKVTLAGDQTGGKPGDQAQQQGDGKDDKK